MGVCKFLPSLSVFILLLPGLVLGQLRYKIENPFIVVQPGQEATLTCRVSNYTPWLHKLYWIKRQENHTDYDVVLSQQIISDKYKASQRLSYKTRHENTDTLADLTIKDAELSDSGYYGCIFTEGEVRAEEARWATLSVVDTVKKVQISTEGNMEENDIMIRCEVSGGNPEAHVTITLDQEDITAKFRKEVKVKVTEPGDVNMKRIENDITLVSAEPLVTDLDSERTTRNLTCKASVQGQVPPKYHSIKLSLPGPEVNCNSEMAEIGKVVQLTCKVKTVADLTMAMWNWTEGDGSKQSLLAGQSDSKQNVASTGKKEGKYEIFVLEIKQFDQSMMDLDFEFLVKDENDQTASGTAQPKKAKRDGPSLSDGWRLLHSPLLSFICFLFLLMTSLK